LLTLRLTTRKKVLREAIPQDQYINLFCHG